MNVFAGGREDREADDSVVPGREGAATLTGGRGGELRHGEAGFTLLELLIAMTLLGLLMVLLFGGLRFGARVWERSEAHTTDLDDIRIAQTFIRSEIEQAYPLLVLADPLHPHIDFDGAADAVRFLASAPTGIASAGRVHIDLRAVSQDGGTVLMVKARPELSWDDTPGATHAEVLLTGVRSLSFSYFGSENPDAPARWQDIWTNRLHLPRLVRLRVAFEPGDKRIWPELVIAPRIAVDINCLYDPLTKACRGR